MKHYVTPMELFVCAAFVLLNATANLTVYIAAFAVILIAEEHVVHYKA